MGRTDISLESDRLVLRQLRLREANDAARFFSRNRKFHDRTDRPTSFYTPAFWRKRIADERRAYRADRGISLYLFSKDTGEILGAVIFDQISRGNFQSCFLGYLLGKEHEGKGYMTEALRTAIPFLFEEMNLHRISAAHVPGNRRSCRVLKGLGFRTVGLEQDYLRINNRWRDHEVHVLINKNWKEKK